MRVAQVTAGVLSTVAALRANNAFAQTSGTILARGSTGWTSLNGTAASGGMPYAGNLGSGCYAAVPSGGTLWPNPGTSISLTRQLQLSSAVNGATLFIAVDDDASVSINNTVVAPSTGAAGGCKYWNRQVLIPNGLLQAGSNTIQVNAFDYICCGRSVDIEIAVVSSVPPVRNGDTRPVQNNFRPGQILTSADPVNTHSGDYEYTHTDLAIAGRGPSPVFLRAHASNDPRTGPLGIGWTHNYKSQLRLTTDGTQDIVLVGPQGRSDRYVHQANGSYVPPSGVSTLLKANSDGTFSATLADQTGWLSTASGS